MTNVEAGITEGKILGKELSKVVASIFGQDLMHDSIKCIAKWLYPALKDSPDSLYYDANALKYWNGFKEEKNAKIKAAEKFLVWTETIVKALIYVDEHFPQDKAFQAEMDILGRAFINWNVLYDNVDDFYSEVSENFLDETDDCIKALEDYYYQIVSTYNSNESHKITTLKMVQVLVELILKVFIWCEEKIKEE